MYACTLEYQQGFIPCDLHKVTLGHLASWFMALNMHMSNVYA